MLVGLLLLLLLCQGMGGGAGAGGGGGGLGLVSVAHYVSSCWVVCAAGSLELVLPHVLYTLYVTYRVYSTCGRINSRIAPLHMLLSSEGCWLD